MPNEVLVNDTVRIKVKFVDINSSTGAQIPVTPVSVTVTIKKSDNSTLLTQSITVSGKISDSEYFYDFTPSQADAYRITFNGILSNGSSISVNQLLYVNTASTEYEPSATLKSDQMITFCSELDPLYIDPEELLMYFPDASLTEIRGNSSSLFNGNKTVVFHKRRQHFPKATL
jgi:hypothetical protein